MKIVVVLTFLLLISSCKIINNEDQDYWGEPSGSFATLTLKFIDDIDTSYTILELSPDTFTSEDSLYFIVSEPYATNGDDFPINGDDLYFNVKTNGGDVESFNLDEPLPSAIFTFYPREYFSKKIPFKYSQNVSKHNGIVELKDTTEYIYGYYLSIFHKVMIEDMTVFVSD